MGSIVRHIDDMIDEHGSKENYLKYLNRMEIIITVEQRENGSVNAKLKAPQDMRAATLVGVLEGQANSFIQLMQNAMLLEMPADLEKRSLEITLGELQS